MSLKKRMFRFNMLILFVALFSLMVIMLFVLILFEDSLEEQIYEISQTELEPHMENVKGLLEENRGSMEELQEQVGKWNYQAAVIADGRVVSGDSGSQMRELAEHFRLEDQSGQTGIFSFRKSTIVGKYLEEQKAYLVAVYFPESDWLFSTLNHSFYAFLVVVFLAGIGAIGFLLFLASFFYAQNEPGDYGANREACERSGTD